MNCFETQSTALKCVLLSPSSDRLFVQPENISNGCFGMKCAVHIHAPNREKHIDFWDPTFLKSRLEFKLSLLWWHHAWLLALAHSKILSIFNSSQVNWRDTECMFIKKAPAFYFPTNLTLGSVTSAFESWESFIYKEWIQMQFEVFTPTVHINIDHKKQKE